MQIIAIDELYKSMGILEDEIIYIDTNNLATYDGEYVVLPVTMPLVDYRTGGISGRFSQRIVPVFLGFTMVKDTLLPEEVAYFNRMAPIGCRDERTLNTLRNYGIKSYLHGCITATFPLRDMSKKYDKVYIVDAPKEIEKFIPNHLLNKAVRKTHMHEGLKEEPKQLMQQYYDEYKNEAALVITSLLHCALPCIAAGIPVILLKSADAVTYRFAWLEKLTKIYTGPEFKEINWNQQPVLFEEHKNRVKNLTIKRLRQAHDEYSEIFDLSLYYEIRERKHYINDACQTLVEYIDKNWINKYEEYNYSIWGLTQIGEYMISYINKNYPNAKLCHVYDSYRKEGLSGIVSEHPDMIKKFPDELVLVATNGAVGAAEIMRKLEGNENLKFAYMKIVI
ncbi:MAG: hypothetical protein AUK51_01370 [Comamonadaceae bacterium CG2_30_59_20]|nr:MAG: hypothetical protein AUK51_01370 [Comamonadaceae bacterium CG2_30_59_20]